MIYMLRNAVYNAKLEASQYEGPKEFTYGADNGAEAVELVGLDYDDPLYEKVLDEMTLEDLVNQYIAYLEELPGIMMPKENPSDSPLGIVGTIGQRTKGTVYEVSEDDPAYGYHTNAYVGGPVVAATFSPFLQAEEGRLIANDALWSGYSTWFGPGLNLHRTPYNGRNVGYYSEDSVLTGLMNGILRGEWGFNGLMITDSVKSAQYFLPRECLMAGNDMMLGGSNNGKAWEFTEETVSKDIVLQSALRESYHRKLYFYVNSVLMNGVTKESAAGITIVWWKLILRILGGLSFVGFIVCFILFIRSTKKEDSSVDTVAASRSASEGGDIERRS